MSPPAVRVPFQLCGRSRLSPVTTTGNWFGVVMTSASSRRTGHRCERQSGVERFRHFALRALAVREFVKIKGGIQALKCI
jgi:hypothetical protein